MLGQMPFDSHRTPVWQTVLFISLSANWRQILQHAAMREIATKQHVATPPPQHRAALCKLLMCCWLVLLSSSGAWAALSSDSPNHSAQFEEAAPQRTTLCHSLPDELPVPAAQDMVAAHLRQTIQRTQDKALQAKLRTAYLRYLGCQADIPQEH